MESMNIPSTVVAPTILAKVKRTRRTEGFGISIDDADNGSQPRQAFVEYRKAVSESCLGERHDVRLASEVGY